MGMPFRLSFPADKFARAYIVVAGILMGMAFRFLLTAGYIPLPIKAGVPMAVPFPFIFPTG